MNEYKKYDRFYILRIDISKYFYSIDHNILKDMLKGKLSSDEYRIICSILDSTNEEYVNDEITYIKSMLIGRDRKRISEIDKLPIYEYGMGLPIGNMTSQFLSIYYLYKLDHYIVNDLGLKHMVKYMDDYVILCSDREYLRYVKDIIIDKLNIEYKLRINEKKTFIIDSVNGFEFLVYRYRVINNKIYISIKSENKRRRNNNIKKNDCLYSNGFIDYKRYFNSVNNYMNSYKYIRI